MVFVADDLGAWLVGLLADAGRKKLTALVLGSAQERALRQAAAAAIQDTADEMSPSNSEQADQIVGVISEVFRRPMPDAPLVGPVTLLEGLQAGVAGQLAVLDDAGLTGTGQSSADVLGVPGTVLAEKLTDHLVRQIVLRGSGGGPLTPLADQLNHDRTHRMLARLTGEGHDALAQAGDAVAGRPLSEVIDPFALEVHRPVQLEDPPLKMPLLPRYVPREHDSNLGSVVRAAAEGSSGIAVLVGGSSTGKTRACWEALQVLREQPERWRIWHPIDPTRPDAALRELPGIGPRTVVWLNEAQFYLDAPGGLGERVAAGLRELLRDPIRRPVLMLATLWPDFWDALTTRPHGDGHGHPQPDRHSQARELLTGRDINVPTAFTPDQLQELSEAGDLRLAWAAREARDGHVAQFLAGVPELLARCRNASPAASALILAAMDARRMGMGPALPHAFLTAAAPGYLTDSQWDQLAEDWPKHLKQALAYAAAPCNGIPGPLTRIRSRPSVSATGNDGPVPEPAADPLDYRLADYLDQSGRHAHRDRIPPKDFWAAAASYADRTNLLDLAEAAQNRGRYRSAAQLYKIAVERGDTYAAYRLVEQLHTLHPTDERPATWAATHAALDTPEAVACLLQTLHHMGAGDQVTALLARDPAACVGLDQPAGVAMLLVALSIAGEGEQLTALSLRAASLAALNDAYEVSMLLRGLRQVDVMDQVATLLARDPAAQVRIDQTGSVNSLLLELLEADAEPQFTALAARAASRAPLDDPFLGGLLFMLDRGGAREQIAALLARDPAAHASLDNEAVAVLRVALQMVGARDQVAALIDRRAALIAARVAVSDPSAVAELLPALNEAGAHEQVTELATRAAAQAPLDDAQAVAELLVALNEAGAHEQVTELATRAAAQAPLDDAQAVAELLLALNEAGAHEQVTELATRGAAYFVPRSDFRNAHAMAKLLAVLRDAGAREQAERLIDRLPAAGMFQAFCQEKDRQHRFRFGRETSGRPAGPWGWSDLY